jgi:uncharacterized FlaG/YvyC family protein
MDIGPIQPGYLSTGSANPAYDQHSTAQSLPADELNQQRELIKAVRALNGAELFGENTELTFVFDRQSHRTLVRVVDKSTGEVITQIPPAAVLRLMTVNSGAE